MKTAVILLGWTLQVAEAHDPAPAMFVPSTAPERSRSVVAEGQMGMSYRTLRTASDGGGWLRGTAQWGRLAGGFHLQGMDGAALDASGWLGLAVIDSETVRLQVFGEAGTQLRAGASFVARTNRGGIGGHGYQFDLGWGPAWVTGELGRKSWSGPFDLLASLPEAGVAMPLHPRGTQFLRIGVLGPSLTATYRLDLTANRHGGFVLESMLGAGPLGGVATIAVGWGGGPERRRARNVVHRAPHRPEER